MGRRPALESMQPAFFEELEGEYPIDVEIDGLESDLQAIFTA